MNNTNNTHEINTLEDIVDKVPQEQIDLFLQDLKAYYTAITLAKSINEIVPGSVEYSTTMTWVNDGKNDVNINIELKEK